jgi:O-antigen ligase
VIRLLWAGGLVAVGVLLSLSVVYAAQAMVVAVLATMTAALIFVARRRAKAETRVEDAAEPPPVIAAVLLPSVAALSYYSKVVSAGVLLEIAVLTFLVTRGVERQRAHPALWLLVAAGVPVWLRVGSVGSIFKALLVCAIVIALATRYPAKRMIVSVVDAAGLYLALNVFGWAIGLQSPSAVSRFGGFQGGLLFSKRVLFPFSTSINVPPAIAAAYLVGLLLLSMGGRRLNTARVAGMVLAVFVLLAASARTPITVAIAIALLAIWARPVLIRASVVLVPAALCIPFYFSLAQPLVNSVVTAAQGLIPALHGRSGQATDLSLNGRQQIWGRSLSYFWNHAPAKGELIGYGTGGHIKSGASSQYASIFSNLTSDPLSISPHSSALQQLFDAGVLGLLVLLIGVTVLVATLAARSRETPLSAAATLFITTLFLCFVVESSGAPEDMTEVYVLILLAAASASTPWLAGGGTSRVSIDGSPPLPAGPRRFEGPKRLGGRAGAAT